MLIMLTVLAPGNPLYLALHAEKNDLKAMMKSVKVGISLTFHQSNLIAEGFS